MTKAELLYELSNEMFITLQPSAIHGIGVFALCAIPEGCKTIFSKNVGNWISISIEEINALPQHARNFVETYCLYDEENYYVPDYGFKVMDMVNYLNHSPTPNIISVNHGEYFEAITDIPKGTELLIDYTAIVNTTEY